MIHATMKSRTHEAGGNSQILTHRASIYYFHSHPKYADVAQQARWKGGAWPTACSVHIVEARGAMGHLLGCYDSPKLWTIDGVAIVHSARPFSRAGIWRLPRMENDVYITNQTAILGYVSYRDADQDVSYHSVSKYRADGFGAGDEFYGVTRRQACGETICDGI